MIVSDFYPTVVALNAIEITAAQPDIAGYTGSQAYFVGYTDLPEFMDLSTMTYTDDEVTLTPLSKGHKKNFGYGAWYDTGIDAYWTMYNITAGTTQRRYFRTYNQLDVGLLRVDVNVSLSIVAAYGDTPDTLTSRTVDTFTQFASDGDKANVTAIIDFLSGKTTITVRRQLVYADDWLELTFSIDDMDDGMYKFNEQLAHAYYTGVIFISKVEVVEPSYDNGTPFDDSTNSYPSYSSSPMAFAQVANYYIGSNHYPEWTGRGDFTNYTPYYVLEWYGDTPSLTSSAYNGMFHDGDYLFGGLDFTIKKSNSVFTNQNVIFYTGNVVCANYQMHAIIVFTILKPLDVLRYLAMQPRLRGYAPLFNGNELTTDFTDDVDDLDEWQRDITQNGYTEDDNPDWIAPDPEDSGDLTPNETIAVGGAADFTTSYVLTASAVSKLGQTLWAGIRDKSDAIVANFFNIDDTNATYYYNNIIDYFVSLKYYPLSLTTIASMSVVEGVNVGAGASGIYIGGGVWQLSSLTPVIDGGYIVIPVSNGDFRDYEPYVTMSAYVPFCGTVDLTPSEVVGTTLSLQYAVDLITGQCTAYITKASSASQVVASLNGQLGFDMLITGNTANSSAASFITSLATKIAAPATQLIASPTAAPQSLLAGGADIMINTPSYLSMSPLVTGTSNSMCAMLNPLRFAVVVKRHAVQIPSTYGASMGYVINKTYTLSSLQGYTVCDNPDLSGIVATTDELRELYALLTTGVIL